MAEIDSYDIDTLATSLGAWNTFTVAKVGDGDRVTIDIDNDYGQGTDEMTREQFEVFVTKTREIMGWTVAG